MNWLLQNMQKWTPFSTIVLLAFLTIAFITIWDSIHGIALPAYIVALLGLILGGSGAGSLVTHGVNITNNTVEKVAQISEGLKTPPNV